MAKTSGLKKKGIYDMNDSLMQLSRSRSTHLIDTLLALAQLSLELKRFEPVNVGCSQAAFTHGSVRLITRNLEIFRTRLKAHLLKESHHTNTYVQDKKASHFEVRSS
jgi:hypothetical protein